MTRPNRRIIVIALALGMVTNLLVTAWCVWRVATDREVNSGYVKVEDRLVEYFVEFAPGKRMITWAPGTERAVGVDTGATLEAANLPAWVTIHDPEFVNRVAGLIDPRGRTAYRIDIAYGWPMLSFMGGVTRPPNRHDYGKFSDISTTRPGAGVLKEERTLPLKPIVPGMLVNTAIYAVSWMVFLFSRAAVRRARRRRRRACIACGYDRHGLTPTTPCPECGATSTATAYAAPPARAGGSDREAA